jgi:hypothetical protein
MRGSTQPVLVRLIPDKIEDTDCQSACPLINAAYLALHAVNTGFVRAFDRINFCDKGLMCPTLGMLYEPNTVVKPA